MTKKVLAILCGLVLTTAFYGCGDEEETGAPSTTETVTITYMIDDFEDGTSPDMCDVLADEAGGWYAWVAEGAAGAEQSVNETNFCDQIEAAGGAKDDGGYLPISGVSAGDGNGLGAYFDLGDDELTKNPVDFSLHSGVAFWAKGAGKLRFSLNMPDFIPVEEGGACDPEDTANSGLCWNYHGVEVTVNSEEWVEYHFAFGDLSQHTDWTDAVVALDPTKIAAFHIEFPAAGGSADYDIQIDQIGFYTEE